MSGKLFCWIAGSATRPPKTITNITRLAATWLRANQAMMPLTTGTRRRSAPYVRLRRACVARRPTSPSYAHLHAVDHGAHGRDHHALTALEPVAHHDTIRLDPQHLDRALMQPRLGVHHQHPAVVAQRDAWQQGGPVHVSALYLGLDEETHRQRRPAPALLPAHRPPIGIVHAGDHVDHAAARIDLALCAHDASLPAVTPSGKVGPQPHVGAGSRLAVELEQRQLDEVELGVGDREPDLGLIDGVDLAH